jgi:hypothetical protein
LRNNPNQAKRPSCADDETVLKLKQVEESANGIVNGIRNRFSGIDKEKIALLRKILDSGIIGKFVPLAVGRQGVRHLRSTETVRMHIAAQKKQGHQPESKQKHTTAKHFSKTFICVSSFEK